jgi:DNA-binding transcriptional MerR regulator
MHSCNPFASLAPDDGDDIWVNSGAQQRRDDAAQEYSITDLATEFDVTHRALRFYESRGLLTPRREGRRRIFDRGDRERLALILQGKKLGFTLSEISRMVEAQSGRASGQTLTLTAEKCLEQIAFFERQMREASAALAELRRIHLLLCVQSARPDETPEKP